MASAVSNLIIIGGLLYVGYYLYTQTDVIDQLKTLLKGDGGQRPGGGTTTPTPAAIVSGGNVGAGAGAAISTDTTCSGTPLTRDTGNGREEWESKNVPWNAYEVTWCGTFSGDDLTFKLYGPSHSGSACCWCVIHVKENGQIVAGGEGPHPSSNCEHSGSSKGGSGKAPCYKATIEPGPIQKGYALVNGKWELRMEYKGPCGCSKKSSTKTGNTLMVRNDGTANTKCASVKPLGGAGAGAGAGVGTSASSSGYARNYYTGRMIYPQQSYYNRQYSQKGYNKIPYI
jgi:hypothetical protein